MRALQHHARWGSRTTAPGRPSVRVRRIARLALYALLLLAGAAPAANAGAPVGAPNPGPPRWVHLTPPASPPAGFELPIAYDAATKQLILVDSVNGATWLWDGTTWTPAPLAPSTRPPTRSDAVMAYDAATKQLILFGGISGNNKLNDTWSWNGSGWTQLFPATSPPPTLQATMAFDPNSGQLVLFGGTKYDSGGNGATAGDTWIWNGSAWTQAGGGTPPPARLGAAMAYDSATSQLLMFGGVANENFLGDTWNWGGITWSNPRPASHPSPRSFPTMAYDSTTRQLLLVGGANQTTAGGLNDTWTWGGSSWVRQAPQAVLNPARYGAALADDPSTGQLVLFGGANAGASLGDTWVWTPLAVQTAALPTGAVGVRYSASLQAVAGVTPYTWSVSSGVLPPGLSLSSAGAITGTPTRAGATTFTVQAVDSTVTTPASATRALTVKINPAPAPAVWVGNGANSDLNAFALTATGNATPMATLSGPLTGLNGIGALAFDSV
jgi:hypothetical protein